jgi:hypothetical protein
MNKELENIGPGRPRGSLNRRTELAIELVSKSKKDPLETLCHIINWELEEIGFTEEEIKSFDPRTRLELIKDAAKEVMPYVYSKLKTTEIKIDEETKKGLTLAYANPKHT